MAERVKLPTPKQVEDGQQLFTAGSYQEARIRVGGIVMYPPHDFSRRDTSEKRRLLSAARIFVRSSINLARQEQNGLTVASELGQAKQVIDGFYNSVQVRTVSPTIDTDVHFPAEMRRDKAAYLLTLAALTGNNAILTGAIWELDVAIASLQEKTESMFLQFERQRIRHRQEPDAGSFSDLTNVFRSAVNASLAAGNKERAARITARYIFDAEKWEKSKNGTPNSGQSPELAAAVGVYGQIVGDDEKLRPILTQERRRELREAEMHARWQRTTPKGETYAHLQLS